MSTCSAQRLRVRGSFIACKLKHRQSSSSTPAADRSIGRVVVSTRRRSTIEAQETRDRRSPVNTALLVLRIIPGLLLMGHGLQKLVPPGYSPPVLHAVGHRHTGAGFESLGIRPAVVAAVLAGSAELVAGSSLAAGLLTRVGTVLVGAVMIRAILKVHASNGIWGCRGRLRVPARAAHRGLRDHGAGRRMSLGRLLAWNRRLGRHQLDDQPRCALGDRAGRRPRRRPGGGPGIPGVEAHPDPREPAGGALMRRGVAGLKCADLVDAMGRMHRHRCHILDLVSPTPDRILFGPAVTISYFPSCAASLDPDRYNLANLFYETVGDEPAGKVVVLASNGYTDTSMGGGTKLLRLQENGCAGVITDGRLRDFDELARYDFAAYCSGET